MNPCLSNPCGPFAQCNAIGDYPSCSCLPNYYGSPPNCHPECVLNSDCPSNKACIRNHCVDPCPGSCGVQAICRVINHLPVCTCAEGYIGNAFTSCQPAPQQADIPQDKCNPSPCANNAQCNDGICTCLPGLQGDPYTLCRPECVLNSDCPSDKACLRSKCVNPCEGGTCAPNALCTVYNHIPMCSCPSGMEGNPFIQCRPVVQPSQDEYHGCRPSPCGSFGQCREINGQAVCSCLPGYSGTPPTCHPECTVNSDCPSNQACSNQKCTDPCPGACGINTNCKTVNHYPICNCLPRYTGNALSNCYPIGKNVSQSMCVVLCCVCKNAELCAEPKELFFDHFDNSTPSVCVCKSKLDFLTNYVWAFECPKPFGNASR